MNIGEVGSSYAYQAYSSMNRMQKPSATELFSKLDKSGDGSIDQSELETMISGISAKTGQSINVEEQFSQFDANGDGSYNNEELASFMEANKPDAPSGGGQSASSCHGDGDCATCSSQCIKGIMESASNTEMNTLLSMFSPSDDTEETSSSSSYLDSLNESSSDSSTNNYLALMDALKSTLQGSNNVENGKSSTYDYFSKTMDSLTLEDYTSANTEV